MARRLTLEPVERETLVQAVKHHAKAYVRERAAALLKDRGREVGGVGGRAWAADAACAGYGVSVAESVRGERDRGAADPPGTGSQARSPPRGAPSRRGSATAC